jgi:nucleotide-binding universal stress UspA family protein
MNAHRRRVLIAVKSVREVTWLVDIALGLLDPGSEVDVLHVGEPDPSAYRAGEQAVREALDQLHVHGIEATAHVHPGGRPVDEIIRLAGERGAGIIVLGAGGTRTFGIGGTSRELVAHAEQPVVLVPMSATLPSTRLARVLVAVGSEEDIPSLVESVRLLGVRQVVVAHVARPVAIHTGSVNAFAEIPETSTAVIRQAVTSMRRAGFSATAVDIRDGLSVGDAIEEAAQRTGANVIAVASRRLSPLGAAIRGSTAYAIVSRAKRPVLFAQVATLPSTATG